MIPSCILLNPATRNELQAACVQAEAALQAGAWQASATQLAGWLTLVAGMSAILAGWLTYRAARQQMDAAAKAQDLQRSHELKRSLYVPATKAIGAGLNAVVRLSDLRKPIDEALQPYHDSISELLSVHLVMDLKTADKFLAATKAMQELHQTLIPKRAFRPVDSYSREEHIQWARKCTSALEQNIPSIVPVLFLFRRELGQPMFDEDKYTQLIVDGISAAISRNEVLFEEMVSAWLLNEKVDQRDSRG